MEDIIYHILEKLGKYELQLHYLNEFVEHDLLERIKRLELNNEIKKKEELFL